MNFTLYGTPTGSLMDWLASGIRRVMERHGFAYTENGANEVVRVVFNLMDPEKPRPYRRKAQATFVIGLVQGPEVPDNVLATAYPLLVRGLCNLLIYVVDTGEGPRTFFVTLEQGYYPIPYEQGNDEAYFEHLFRRLEPLATSQLVVNNIFHTDLEEELWEGNEITRQIYEAGRRLDAMDLLPAPFPIRDFLSDADYRHLQRLYTFGGLSYGNLSARQDERRFWMSASGVNKADLRVPGEHILLVKGYDPEQNAMLLSVPPHVTPRRVSVDAIEHWLIYTEHPQVGAILHVRAWMEGIPSTEINYPCGTLQLGQAVAELVRKSPDPARAVIGLKNHGLTITGPNLEDIFERIEGKILRQVPMS